MKPTINVEKRQKGYIYTIRSHQTNELYVGSTFQPLSKRLREHRCYYKKYIEGGKKFYSSFLVLKYDDHYIELEKTIESCNKIEMRKIEGETIRKYDCVNKNIAGGQSREEKSTVSRIWRQNNDDVVKKHRINNREYHYKKTKEWKEQNKDKIRDYNKMYCEMKKFLSQFNI